MAVDALRVPVTADTADLISGLLKASAAVMDFKTKAGGGLDDFKKGAEGALKGAAAAHKSHGDAMGFSNQKAQEATHVVKALFDEYMAGGSILRGVAMEGGRLFDIFGSKIKPLVSWMGAVPVSARVAGGAIIGVGAAAAAAALSYESSLARMQRATEGVGRLSGMSSAQLRQAADRGAVIGNMGYGEARSAAAGFAQAGLSSSTTAELLGQTPRFARFTDQDNASAAAQLAKDFQDPVAGAADLDKIFGFLNDRISQTILDLKAQGDIEGARRVEMEAFSEALKKTTDDTWAVGDGLREIKRWAGGVWDAAGKGLNSMLGGDATPQEQLAHWQSLLPGTSDNPLAFGMYSRSYVQDKIDRMTKQINTRPEDPAQAKREADANALSKQVGPVVRSILPELVQQQTYTNNIELFKRAMSDPLVAGDLKMSGADLYSAASRTAVMKAFSGQGTQAGQDYKLRMADIDAFSAGEKAVIEARRAELQVLRETGDVSRAAAAAQMSMNEAIAKANSDAQDSLDKANQDFDLIGLSPYARSQQEIRNKYEGDGGLIAKASFDVTDIHKDDDIQGDLNTAAKRIRDTFDSISPKIDVAGDKLVSAIEGVATKVGGAAGGAIPSLPVPAGIAGGGDLLGRSAAAIKSVESGGNYGILGPVTAAGDRAYGAYQVMGANIPSWSKSALGYSLTPSQFLANPAAQDAIFNHQFGASLAKYGNVQDAASVWFTGRPLAQGANSRDILGTSGSQYASMVAAKVGGDNPLIVRPRGGDQVAPVALDAPDKYRQSERRELAGVDKQNLSSDFSFYGTPGGDATRQLADQQRLLDVQTATFGQSQSSIQGAIAAQTLWNRYVDQGITPTGELADKIKAYGTAAAGVAKQQEELTRRQQSQVQASDLVRSDATDLIANPLEAIAHHQSPMAALRQVGLNIGDQLIRGGAGMLTKGLFGQQGSNLFGSSGPLGFLGSLFKFADGGVMTSVGPLPLRRYAGGGVASSPQVAMYGEGAGPEAFVPLPDGRSIPVNIRVPAPKVPDVAPRAVSSTVVMGDSHVHVAGDVSEKNMAAIQAGMRQAHDQAVQTVTRNFQNLAQRNGNYRN